MSGLIPERLKTVRRENCGWAAIFSMVDVRVKTEVCPLFFQLGTGESLKRTFERAGLEPIAMERINTILRYVSAEEALVAAFSGGPVALAYSRFDATTLRTLFCDEKSEEPLRILAAQ
jgi:hypothetical protein